MEKRYKSIDILRAIAIIEMIFVHVYMLFVKNGYMLIGYIIVSIFGVWTEGFFLTCAGISFFISISKKINKNQTKKDMYIDTLKRASFLFVITLLMLLFFGFTLNMFFTSIIYWSIFQVIVFSMILFFFIPFIRTRIRRVIIICLFFVLYIAFYIIQFTKFEFLSILVSGGSFPFLPWSSFYVFGMLIGDLILNTEIEKIKKIICFYFLFGVIFLFISLFWMFFLDIRTLLVLHITAYSGFSILFALLYYKTDIYETDNFIEKSLVRWGKVAFSLYYFHLAILGFCLILFPLIIADFYINGYFLYQYLFFTIVIILIIEIFLRIWEKFNFILGIEWFMDKLVKRTLFSKARDGQIKIV